MGHDSGGPPCLGTVVAGLPGGACPTSTRHGDEVSAIRWRGSASRRRPAMGAAFGGRVWRRRPA